MVAAAYFLPTPVGGNAIRLTLLFAVPVVAAFVDWRWWAAALAVVAAAVVQTPVTLGTLTGAGSPDTRASYYAPLLAEIRSQGQLTGRVEVPGRERALGIGLRGRPRAPGPRLAAAARHQAQRRRLLQAPADRGELPRLPDRQRGRVRRRAGRAADLLRQARSHPDPRRPRLPGPDLEERPLDALPRRRLRPRSSSHPGGWSARRPTASRSARRPTPTVRINVRWLPWLDTDASGGACISRDGRTLLYRTGAGAGTSHTLTSALDPGGHC